MLLAANPEQRAILELTVVTKEGLSPSVSRKMTESGSPEGSSAIIGWSKHDVQGV